MQCRAPQSVCELKSLKERFGGAACERRKRNSMNRKNGCKQMIGAILFIFATSVLVQPIFGQSQNISGTVLDPSGGVVPGATIEIMDLAKGGTARQVTTDNAGRFQAIDIQPGRYLIRIQKEGFKKAELTVTLDVNSKLDVGQISLQVGT